MRLLLLTALSILFSSPFIHAQHSKCSTVEHWEAVKRKDPGAEQRRLVAEADIKRIVDSKIADRTTGVITIPVVVHVIYNTNAENISEAQINSQIDALNKDFRNKNTDSLATSHPFYSLVADCGLQFCLATKDPSGNVSTGITRTKTDTTGFSGKFDAMKRTATGGMNNWEPTKYLNIWVCNLLDNSGGVLGYATLPSDLSAFPADDGLVVDYRVFGTVGEAGNGYPDNALGRTTTHEVGHWLNLSHIWGDAQCGNDQVDDTPPQFGPNESICPTFPHNDSSICGTDSLGEMYMNYMDYVTDQCMVMFSKGQKARMLAVLSGIRSTIVTSAVSACSATTTSVADNVIDFEINVFPNPLVSYFNVSVAKGGAKDVKVTVFDLTGQQVKSVAAATNTNGLLRVNMADKPIGTYFVKVEVGEQIVYKKVVLNR